MASARRLIAAGSAALIIGLLLTFPARVAYHWFAPQDLALSGITGSVWNGRATEGSAGAAYFRNLSWRFRPTSLFGLQAGFNVAADLPGGSIESRVGFALGGDVRIGDLTASVPLALIEGPAVPAGVEGLLNLQFERLVVEDELPTEADGTATVSGLVIPALSPTPLGDYRVLLQTSEDGISGTFEDVAGALDIEGSLHLAKDRSYSVSGRISATAEAPASVHEQLRFLGSADPEGWRQFRLEGAL